MKIAVVLFNLGGPDSLDAVEPFLRNLFSDPAIIGLPGFVRVSAGPVDCRTPRAGRARDLRPYRRALADPQGNRRTGACAGSGLAGARPRREMLDRHALLASADRGRLSPRSKAFSPDRIVLLPLYPQYSTTTTGSSLARVADARHARDADGAASRRVLLSLRGSASFPPCAICSATRSTRRNRTSPIACCSPRTACPSASSNAGDPYQWQVERTVQAVLDTLGRRTVRSTRSAIRAASVRSNGSGPRPTRRSAAPAPSGKGLIVVPVAFVSEHSETLVELDIEYGEAGARIRACRITSAFRPCAPIRCSSTALPAWSARALNSSRPGQLCGRPDLSRRPDCGYERTALHA